MKNDIPNIKNNFPVEIINNPTSSILKYPEVSTFILLTDEVVITQHLKKSHTNQRYKIDNVIIHSLFQEPFPHYF